MSAWLDHVARWKDCTDCPLCEQRDRIVLARGSIPADVCFVGEAPGASEDSIGQPFVGPAGILLDKIIQRALPPTVRYALTNLVACYPQEAKAAGHNEPEYNEIMACRDRLAQFIGIAHPRLVVCVGQLSKEYAVRIPGVKYVDIIHPAAILRMPVVQQGFAIQKCIVALRNAVEELSCAST